MASYNKVILMGNLTRDPECRFSAGGTPTLCKFGLGVNRTWTDKETKEKKEEATFIEVVAFGKSAEVISKHLKKGDPLHLEGRLNLDQWETDDGQKRSKLGVVLEKFQFVGGKRG